MSTCRCCQSACTAPAHYLRAQHAPATVRSPIRPVLCFLSQREHSPFSFSRSRSLIMKAGRRSSALLRSTVSRSVVLWAGKLAERTRELGGVFDAAPAGADMVHLGLSIKAIRIHWAWLQAVHAQHVNHVVFSNITVLTRGDSRTG